MSFCATAARNPNPVTLSLIKFSGKRFSPAVKIHLFCAEVGGAFEVLVRDLPMDEAKTFHKFGRFFQIPFFLRCFKSIFCSLSRGVMRLGEKEKNEKPVKVDFCVQTGKC